MSRGIIYIAFGERYVAEAIHSARSARRHSPLLPIVLFTDRATQDVSFAEVRVVPMTHMRAKVDYLINTPFEQTLYLDSDTQVVQDLSDMFGLLERFDVAMAHDFSRRRKDFAQRIPAYGAIPYAFPEMNSGVILYNRSAATQRLLQRWQELFYLHKDITRGWDQGTLRIALWESEVRLHTLPVEYNVRPQGVRNRVAKGARAGRDYSNQMAPQILHWHGLHERKWWHRFSPKYTAYRF
jgi:lipopolysaccharide biosynthesis glycosyltransferase